VILRPTSWPQREAGLGGGQDPAVYGEVARQPSLSPGVPSRSSSRQGRAKAGRGDWQNFEREVQPYAAVFLHGPQPHILRIGQLMRQTA